MTISLSVALHLFFQLPATCFLFLEKGRYKGHESQKELSFFALFLRSSLSLSLSLSQLSNLLRRLELFAHALVNLAGRGRGVRLMGGVLL